MIYVQMPDPIRPPDPVPPDPPPREEPDGTPPAEFPPPTDPTPTPPPLRMVGSSPYDDGDGDPNRHY
jgi:hypothetical protein